MEEKAAGKPAEKSNGFVVGKIGSEDPDDGQTPSTKPNTGSSGFVVGKIGSEDPFDQVESIDEASAKPQGFVVGKIGSEDPRDKQIPAEAPSKFVVGKIGSEDPRDAQIPAEAPSNFVVGKIGSEDPRDNQKPAPPTDAEPKGFVVGKIGSEDPRDTQIPAEAPSKFVVGKIGAEDPRDNQKLPDASGSKPSGFVVGKIGAEDPDYAKQGPREDDKTETRPLDSSLRRRDVIPENNKPLERLGQVPNQKMTSRGMPPFGADGATSSFDCVPQGLVVGGYGFQQYHMGGGQDSAYEYFPKEYLLLGGLESKYKKLYEDTIEATNEWLLYRPMVDGDWDILFPAKVSTSGNPSKDLSATFEVTHLTCFIGGMYGLGGKIFGREKDLEIAKKLTDGCVWAYQSTISGIMPEGSQVLPCPSLDKCPFNETLWWENLDPAREWRERQIAEWEEKKAELEKKQGKKTQPIDGDPRKTNDKDKETAGEALEQTAKGFAAEDSTGSSKPIHKRAAVPPPKDGMAPTYENFDVGSELPQSLKDKIGLKTDEQKKPAEVGIQRDPNAPVDSVLEAHRLPPLEPEEQQIILPERPQSHEEFVKQKIMDWGFAPGVTHITSRQYILR
jgi:mannosyl-oligosaccharide alpha-1,2-mannosidase